MHQAKGASTPGIKDDGGCGAIEVWARRLSPQQMAHPEEEWPSYDGSPLLQSADLKLYQSVSALLNFSALDRQHVAI